MVRPAKRPAKKREAAGPTLAQRIVAAPLLSSPADARAKVSAWLGEIAASEAGRALARLLAGSNKLQALIEGVADGSPFLWELAAGEPARLVALLESDPDAHLDALLGATAADVAATADQSEAMRLLRRMKAEAALLIALCDIGGVWPVMRVTAALTQVADAATGAAVRFALNDAFGRGTLVPIGPARPEQGCGLVVLAMGKMGAFELNYSSDIDLIVLFDPDAPALAPEIEGAPLYLRLTRLLVKLLQERTGDGYVFRVDLRLRPDPASTQIVISTDSALSYYESTGQNWERAAMIKARPCAGDLERGGAFLKEIAPFVWRKYFDFAAVADVHAMKRQIHAYRGHDEIAVEGHNIKLGRGGIREIEFFAQTQQLIAGGRNPSLRDRDTLTTLDKLCEDKWIDQSARDAMKEAYCFLRSVEHRLQMMNDEQTQTLPAERAGVEGFARFLGFSDRDAFAKVLLGHLDKVQSYYARLFEKQSDADRPVLAFPREADDHKTLDRLAELGFRAPLEASNIIRHWLSENHRTLRGETAHSHIEVLLPALLEHLARTDNPNATLVLFDHFLTNLHRPARLLSLLRQNPDLIALIVLVLGIAPRLGDTLARHPQVMDALVDPSFFGSLPDEFYLGQRFETALAQSRHDEDLLERIRMLGLEYMFLIGVRILSGTVTARQAGEAYARLADAVIRAVHRAIGDNFAAAHGHMRSEETAVVALGKLGGYEMTATSDLDLILIYDFNDQHPESDGVRPLYGAQYFARLTQRLINALTAQTNYGALYQVDMRLRPSGRAGPLATQVDGFAAYQETEAWTWEHMALTRARVVSASPAFRTRIERVIRGILCQPRDEALIAGDVVEMRSAIAKEKGYKERWDLKYVAGGLVDIEFITQYLQLVHAHRVPDILDTSTARVLDKAWSLRVLTAKDAEVLRPAVELYQDLTQILRLCLPGKFDPKTAGSGLLRLLARAADVPDFAALEATVIDTQAKVRESYVRILGKEP